MLAVAPAKTQTRKHKTADDYDDDTMFHLAKEERGDVSGFRSLLFKAATRRPLDRSCIAGSSAQSNTYTRTHTHTSSRIARFPYKSEGQEAGFDVLNALEPIVSKGKIDRSIVIAIPVVRGEDYYGTCTVFCCRRTFRYPVNVLTSPSAPPTLIPLILPPPPLLQPASLTLQPVTANPGLPHANRRAHEESRGRRVGQLGTHGFRIAHDGGGWKEQQSCGCRGPV